MNAFAFDASAHDAEIGTSVAEHDDSNPPAQTGSLAALPRSADGNSALLIREGGVCGIALQLSREEADNIVGMVGYPSFALVNGDTACLGWWLDAPINSRSKDFARLDRLARQVTGHGALAQHVPLPGVDGWRYRTDEDRVAVEEDHRIVFKLEELEARFLPAGAVSEPVGDMPCRYKDAVVHGTIDPDVLTRPLTYAVGKRRDDRFWKNKDGSFADLIDALAMHQVGEKDGRAFLQGFLIGNQRIRTAMKSAHVIVLDIDNGTPIAEVVEKVKQHNHFAIIYSTHSHRTDTTDVLQKTFTAWAAKNQIASVPTSETLAAYLVAEKGYTQEVATTVKYVGVDQFAKGVVYLAEHVAMDKSRIVFPLPQPYLFGQQPDIDHEGGMQRWGNLIRGLAKLYGLHADESCTDPSRLFYFPRHAKGAPHETHIIPGQLLDLLEIEEVHKTARIKEAHKTAKRRSDPPRSARADMSDAHGASKGAEGDATRHTPGGINVLRWVAEHAQTFELLTLIDEHCPGKIRNRRGTKAEIECPFDASHSNAGDPNDVACFVQNASDNVDSEHGFAFSCMHNSCRNRTRAEMICEAIRQSYFDESVLLDKKYQCEPAESEGNNGKSEQESCSEAVLQQLRERIQTFSKATEDAAIWEVIEAIAGANPDPVQRSGFINALAAKTGRTKKIIEEAFKKARRATRKEPKADPANGRWELNLSEQGNQKCLAACKDALRYISQTEHKLFAYNDTIVRVEESRASGTKRLREINPHALRGELDERVTWYDGAGDNERQIATPLDTAKLLLERRDLPLAQLRGIARTPFFTAEGVLVSKKGYDPESQFLFDPAADLNVPSVPAKPTPEQVEKARQLLNEPFYDFPFDDGECGDGSSSRAHAFAYLLLHFVREMIPTATPIHLTDKPMAGTGAGLFSEVVHWIATGLPPEAQTVTRNDEETKKVITAVLLSGATYFWLDNINIRMDSPHWASVTTSPVWKDRVLGGSRIAEIPIKMIWLWSGINVELSPELARRCVHIRMDAKTDPLNRGLKFRHPNLVQWVKAHRSELVWACLVLIQNWIAKGKPAFTGRLLPSYPEWSSIMGGILEAAQIEGFLGNLGLQRANAGSETDAWEQFIAAWWEQPYATTPRPIGNPEGSGNEWDRERSLVSLLEDHEIDLGIRAHSGSGRMNSLGKLLRKRVDNVFNIKDAQDKAIKVALRSKPKRGQRNGWVLELVKT